MRWLNLTNITELLWYGKKNRLFAYLQVCNEALYTVTIHVVKRFRFEIWMLHFFKFRCLLVSSISTWHNFWEYNWKYQQSIFFGVFFNLNAKNPYSYMYLLFGPLLGSLPARIKQNHHHFVRVLPCSMQWFDRAYMHFENPREPVTHNIATTSAIYASHNTRCSVNTELYFLC